MFSHAIFWRLWLSHKATCLLGDLDLNSPAYDITYLQILSIRPEIKRNDPPSNLEKVGEEPLYLTPYIESGDIETGQAMALVDWTLLEGIRVSIIELP